MNEFIPLGQLPSIAELFKKRSQHIKERLYNLKAADVQTEEQFDLTRSFVRNAILLQPVVFGEPAFASTPHFYGGSVIAKLGDKLRGMIIREVILPFTGSKELFSYAPANVNMSPEAAIIMPLGSCVIVKLNSVFFSKYDALNAARNVLNATLEMIAMNNEAVKEWSAKTEELISRKLLTFRKECIDLYHANDLLTQNSNE